MRRVRADAPRSRRQPPVWPAALSLVHCRHSSPAAPGLPESRGSSMSTRRSARASGRPVSRREAAHVYRFSRPGSPRRPRRREPCRRVPAGGPARTSLSTWLLYEPVPGRGFGRRRNTSTAASGNRRPSIADPLAVQGLYTVIDTVGPQRPSNPSRRGRKAHHTPTPASGQGQAGVGRGPSSGSEGQVCGDYEHGAVHVDPPTTAHEWA